MNNEDFTSIKSPSQEPVNRIRITVPQFLLICRYSFHLKTFDHAKNKCFHHRQ